MRPALAAHAGECSSDPSKWSASRRLVGAGQLVLMQAGDAPGPIAMREILRRYGKAELRRLGLDRHAEWKLSDLYTELNRWAEAEALARHALDLSRADVGPYHLDYLWQSVSLADILLMQGHWDEAEDRFRTLHDHLLQSVGPRHPMTLTAAHYLGQVSLERGDVAAALEQLRQVLDDRLEVHGEHYKWTHYTMNRLGQVLVEAGRADEAIALLERTLELATDAGHRDQSYVLLVLDNLAGAYMLAQDLEAAEACLDEALARAGASLPANNFRRGLLEHRMGRLRELQGRPDEARMHHEYAAQVFSEGFGEDHPWTRGVEARL